MSHRPAFQKEVFTRTVTIKVPGLLKISTGKLRSVIQRLTSASEAGIRDPFPSLRGKDSRAFIPCMGRSSRKARTQDGGSVPSHRWLSKSLKGPLNARKGCVQAGWALRAAWTSLIEPQQSPAGRARASVAVHGAISAACSLPLRKHKCAAWWTLALGAQIPRSYRAEEHGG